MASRSRSEAPAEEPKDEKPADEAPAPEAPAEEEAVDGVPAEPEGPSEEELAARRGAVLGSGSGFPAGPSQADLNPAYAPDAFEAKDDSGKE